jgi:hypothetical protein
MKFIGDEKGIGFLKEMSKTNKSYLKFLLTEAGTNSDHKAYFSLPDGSKFVIQLTDPSGPAFTVSLQA